MQQMFVKAAPFSQAPCYRRVGERETRSGSGLKVCCVLERGDAGALGPSTVRTQCKWPSVVSRVKDITWKQKTEQRRGEGDVTQSLGGAAGNGTEFEDTGES